MVENFRFRFARADFTRDDRRVEIHSEAGCFDFFALQAGGAIGEQADAHAGGLQLAQDLLCAGKMILQLAPTLCEVDAQILRQTAVLDPLLPQRALPDFAAKLRRPFAQMIHVVLVAMKVAPHSLERHDAECVAALDRRVFAPKLVTGAFGRGGQASGIEVMRARTALRCFHQRLPRDPLVPNQRVVEIENDRTKFHATIQTRL